MQYYRRNDWRFPLEMQEFRDLSPPGRFSRQPCRCYLRKMSACDIPPWSLLEVLSFVLRSALILVFATGIVLGSRLDSTTFVVLGDGLAAGASGTGLSKQLQERSFGAQLAGQLGTIFPQANFQPPGPGDVPGEQRLPVMIPSYPQSTVRTPFPPSLFVFNLSVPGLKLADALSRRPTLPLVHNNDSTQTLLNMILGFPALILDQDVPLWTQAEYAVAMNPTLVQIELGYYDAIEAAVAGDPGRMAEVAEFRANYSEIVRRLRANSPMVVLTTVPDPTRTAYFSSVPEAAARLRQPTAILEARYGLATDDLLTESAIRDISTQILHGRTSPLKSGQTLRASNAARIRDRLRAWNAEIRSLGTGNAVLVYDLAAFFERVRAQGIEVAGRTVTGAAFGGFYGLDWLHPGATGHALIANAIIELLNRSFQSGIPLIRLDGIAEEDPVFQYRPLEGGS